MPNDLLSVLHSPLLSLSCWIKLNYVPKVEFGVLVWAAVVVEGEEGIRELEKVKGHQELLVAREVLRGRQHRSPSGRERGRGTGHRELGDTTQETPPCPFLIFLAKI